MSTIDEVLAAAEVVDAVCVIDGETRIISVPTEYKELGVQSDEKVTRVKFQCPKIVGDNIDLTEYNIYINYRNADNKLNSYLVEDVTVTGDTINFSWLLSRHVTESPGTISYIVCAKKSDDTGVINEWNTKVATGIVGIGLEATEEIEEQNIDAIEQILRSIVELENKVDGGGSGESGGYYAPSIDNEGNLSWTASKADMPAVAGANIKGPHGVSGVYVGSGDMPEGYNVQIDPDGRPLQTSGLTTEQVKALDGMFKACAFIKDDISAEYTAFKTAFGIRDSGDGGETEVTLTSISATYDGGDVSVGTAVTDLTGIVVTAHYSDGSNATVTEYTLNGTIAEGNNTITVSYGGKTATFTVNGVAESGGGEETDDGTEWADGVPYVYTLVENEYVGNDNTGGDGIKTYAGWSRTPFLPCKGASVIIVTYIDNTQNKLDSAYGVWYDTDKKYMTNFNQTNDSGRYAVPADACFVILSQDNVVMTNIASITPHK